MAAAIPLAFMAGLIFGLGVGYLPAVRRFDRRLTKANELMAQLYAKDAR